MQLPRKKLDIWRRESILIFTTSTTSHLNHHQTMTTSTPTLTTTVTMTTSKLQTNGVAFIHFPRWWAEPFAKHGDSARVVRVFVYIVEGRQGIKQVIIPGQHHISHHNAFLTLVLKSSLGLPIPHRTTNAKDQGQLCQRHHSCSEARS